MGDSKVEEEKNERREGKGLKGEEERRDEKAERGEGREEKEMIAVLRMGFKVRRN